MLKAKVVLSTISAFIQLPMGQVLSVTETGCFASAKADRAITLRYYAESFFAG